MSGKRTVRGEPRRAREAAEAVGERVGDVVGRLHVVVEAGSTLSELPQAVLVVVGAEAEREE